jgi:hypothetical protein
LKEESQKIAFSPAQDITLYYSPPWIFQHQELLTFTTTERPWDQKKLVNKLNHLNFIDSYVFILCRHQQTGEHILIKAYPQPCIKDELICRLDLQDNFLDPTKYSLDYLMIDDGLTAILAPVHLFSMEGNLLKLNLPDKSQVFKTRKTRRHYCHDISCKVTQDGFNAQGMLIDFTPSALGIKLNGNENMKGFDENNPSIINLNQTGVKLFSGSCRCIRNGIKSHGGKVVFEPISTQMALFPKRIMRNPRQQIAPSFSVSFKHPLIQKNVERDIFEISTAGFSVRDNVEEEILLPGMLIPNISIIYAGILKMDCSVQVLYRQEDKINNVVQFGLAIADIDIQSFTHLNHILSVYLDSNARVSTDVDMEALWEFFFDTGFIYGEKYKHLHQYREYFKNTYKKLYQDNPNIARHFVYEKNGIIYGHIAMVHAYKPSWLIHHFTSRRMGGRLPGPSVLKQIINYTGSFNRLPSAGMDHVMTYYQPNNRIIDRIFGAFTRQIKNPQISSVDIFSYTLFEKTTLKQKLLDNWQLRECVSTDFAKLNQFYNSSSGGLMLNALGLDTSSDSIKKSFADAGFKRDYRTYCLFYKEKQMAFFIVNQSDLGLNLSDLLNSIKIIILEPTQLPWSILSTSVNNLSDIFTEEKIPLLIFPTDYLPSQNILEEKKYALWILQAKHGSDDFLLFTNTLIKIQPGNM